MDEMQESTKDAGRVAIFAAVSTVITYVVNVVLPTIPPEVSAALLVLFMAGITWVDSWIHHNDNIRATGLLPF